MEIKGSPVFQIVEGLLQDHCHRIPRQQKVPAAASALAVSPQYGGIYELGCDRRKIYGTIGRNVDEGRKGLWIWNSQ